MREKIIRDQEQSLHDLLQVQVQQTAQPFVRAFRGDHSLVLHSRNQGL